VRRTHLRTIIGGALFGVAAAIAVGAVMTSADTELPWSFIGGGGGSANSNDYAAGVSLGQGAGGDTASANFGARLGFWAGADAGAPGDGDGDGVADVSDNCPANPNPGQQNFVHPATFAGDHCEDPEPDTVVDAFDNCPDVANTNQANADADDYGDVCEALQCLTIPNYWPTPSDDADCDGFPSTLTQNGLGPESFIGTSGSLKCAATATANDEPTPDRWPVDFNDDQRATIPDVLLYIGKLNYISPDPLYVQRFDLNGDGRVNLVDVLKFVPFLNEVCVP